MSVFGHLHAVRFEVVVLPDHADVVLLDSVLASRSVNLYCRRALDLFGDHLGVWDVPNVSSQVDQTGRQHPRQGRNRSRSRLWSQTASFCFLLATNQHSRLPRQMIDRVTDLDTALGGCEQCCRPAGRGNNWSKGPVALAQLLTTVCAGA